MNPRSPLVALVMLLLGPAVAQADNWPSWRGAGQNGVSNETGLPAVWGPGKNILWELEMPGMGGSTPVAWGDYLFVTSADGKELVLLAISTKGKVLWRRTLGTGDRRVQGGEGNEASASPSTDGKHVYTFIGTGECACHDFEGNEVWKFNAQKRYGAFRIQHGLHTTPLLHEDRLYLSLLHGGGHWLIALDKMTGKEVWKIQRATDARGESKEAYASPCLWSDGKDAYIVVLGADYATAHRLKDGSEVWRLADLNPPAHYSDAFRIIASPAAVADLIVVPTCRGTVVVGVKPSAEGVIHAGSDMEQWRKAKGSPDVPSPTIHDGLVYLCRENGTLLCLDAKTGAQIYERTLQRDRYRGSPLCVDGKLYLTAREGTFSVVKTGRDFELLAVNRLPDQFTASPIVSDGRIYLRGFQKLYAIGAK